MGTVCPHVSKISSLIFLFGFWSITAPAIAVTDGESSCLSTDALPLEISRLPVRFLDLEASDGFNSYYKDADGREDEEEGNDEIDIILMPAPSPDGADTVDVFVRVRQPGFLFVDSEDTPLVGSLEPIGPRRSVRAGDVAYSDVEGNLVAPVWPGDYQLRVERSEVPHLLVRLRFRFYVLSTER